MSSSLPAPLLSKHRSRQGCLGCEADELHTETTVVSPFIAQRAMGTVPDLTQILFCRQCGLRFFDRGLSDAEATRYYEGYRSEDYLVERNRYEPFYTRRAHLKIATWLASGERRQALAATLIDCNAPEQFNSVLDFGGGDGGMIADIPSVDKGVFDLSGAKPLAGIRQFSKRELETRRWRLVVCAQVLEHVSEPRVTVATLANLLEDEGWLYLEVPDEIWSNYAFAGYARDQWLKWIVKKPRLLMAADTLSTACRILLGFLPPFGFIPMREHLQYFTERALATIVGGSGLRVISAGRNAVGQIYVVAVKSPRISSASQAQDCRQICT